MVAVATTVSICPISFYIHISLYALRFDCYCCAVFRCFVLGIHTQVDDY